MEAEKSRPLVEFLGVSDPDDMVLVLTAGFLVLAMFAASVRISLLWANTRMARALGVQLRTDWYTRVLYQPYEYHVSHNSSELISTVTEKVAATINAVISPHAARLYRANDRDGLKKLYKQLARATVAFSAPIALGLALFATPILEFVYGGEYAKIAAEPLIILALAQFAHVMMGSTGVFLSMAGFERDALAGQVVAVLMNGGVAYLLIPLQGATGAAYAVALSLAVWTGIMVVRFYRRFNIRPVLI